MGLSIIESMPPENISAVSICLPVDLYPLIFQHIKSKSTLSKLCIISRVFRCEAERVLYHTICLPEEAGPILSWCKTIVDNPRLAMLVRALTLPSTCNYPSAAALQTMLLRALSSLSKLDAIYTYDIPMMPPLWIGGESYLYPALFQGHPYRLRVFETNLSRLYTLAHWRKFFREQPGIRHWRPDLNPDLDHRLDPHVFPSLTSARIHVRLLNILAPRPIRALEVIELSELSSLNDLSMGLKVLGPTLRTFSLREVGEPLLNYPEYASTVLKILGMEAPFLESLGLESDITMFDQSHANIVTDFVSSLSGLPRLTTLVIMLPNYFHGGCMDEVPDYYYRDRDEKDELLALANAMMKASLSLKRVAFEPNGAWALGRGRYACYTRARVGKDVQGDVAMFGGLDIVVPEDLIPDSNG